jgi:hypothetical protein
MSVSLSWLFFVSLVRLFALYGVTGSDFCLAFCLRLGYWLVGWCRWPNAGIFPSLNVHTILYLCRALAVGSKKMGIEEDAENHNRCFILAVSSSLGWL